MFCPKCSQEQSSADLRFCSRCGFRLEAVTELLARSGMPERGALALLLLRRDTRFGVKMLFLSGSTVPLALAAAALWDSPVPIFAPAAAALVGMGQIGYRLLVESVSGAPALPEKPSSAPEAATTRLASPTPLLSMPVNNLDNVAGADAPTVAEATTEKLRKTEM